MSDIIDDDVGDLTGSGLILFFTDLIFGLTWVAGVYGAVASYEPSYRLMGSSLAYIVVGALVFLNYFLIMLVKKLLVFTVQDDYYSEEPFGSALLSQIQFEAEHWPVAIAIFGTTYILRLLHQKIRNKDLGSIDTAALFLFILSAGVPFIYWIGGGNNYLKTIVPRGVNKLVAEVLNVTFVAMVFRAANEAKGKKTVVVEATSIFQDLSKPMYRTSIIFLGQYSLRYLYNSSLQVDKVDSGVYYGDGLESSISQWKLAFYVPAVLIQIIYVITINPIDELEKSAIFWGNVIALQRGQSVGNNIKLGVRFIMYVFVNVFYFINILSGLPILGAVQPSNKDFVLNVLAFIYVLELDDLSESKFFSWPLTRNAQNEKTSNLTSNGRLEDQFQEIKDDLIDLAVEAKRSNCNSFGCSLIKKEFEEIFETLLAEEERGLTLCEQRYRHLKEGHNEKESTNVALNQEVQKMQTIEQSIIGLREKYDLLQKELEDLEEFSNSSITNELFSDDNESVISQFEALLRNKTSSLPG
jgi:hypothetical protein